jgi:hypothetical protein
VRLPRLNVGEAAVLWLGVLGAPIAWALQHVTGFALTEARCREAAGGGWDVNMDAWTIVVSATAAAVAVAALAAAIVTFRATRDAESEPPRGRIHFLAVIGITIAPLFLAMILMSGLGAILLPECVQS